MLLNGLAGADAAARFYTSRTERTSTLTLAACDHTDTKAHITHTHQCYLYCANCLCH